MMSGLGLAAIALVPTWGCLHKGHAPGMAVKPQNVVATKRSSTTTTATRPATTAASATTVSFSKLNMRLSYPAVWIPKESKEYELLLLPSNTAAQDATFPLISLDIPDLPPHFPGMIPIGLVKNGYLDDLKKELGKTVPLTQEDSPKLAGAQGRMLRSTWSDKDGHRMADTALVLIHADRVYILRARFGVDDRTTPQAFDEIVKSIQWGK